MEKKHHNIDHVDGNTNLNDDTNLSDVTLVSENGQRVEAHSIGIKPILS